MSTIVMIVGSLRKRSFNGQLARAAQKYLEQDHVVKYLNWSEFPIFNQDHEFPTPESVSQARQMIKDADALWIFSPEYNHGVPGALKNAIDWLSRPLEDGSEAVIMKKIVTLSTAGGRACGRYSQASWLSTFDFLQLQVAPVNFTGVYCNHEAFQTDTLEIDSSIEASLQNQAKALLAAIESS